MFFEAIPVLGIAKFCGRGLRPHSDKSKLAIRDPVRKTQMVYHFWASEKTQKMFLGSKREREKERGERM